MPQQGSNGQASHHRPHLAAIILFAIKDYTPWSKRITNSAYAEFAVIPRIIIDMSCIPRTYHLTTLRVYAYTSSSVICRKSSKSFYTIRAYVAEIQGALPYRMLYLTHYALCCKPVIIDWTV